jgi:hypothetical protein
MAIKELFKLSRFKKITIITAGVIIMIMVFTAGIFVGIEKARYSFHWRDNYGCGHRMPDRFGPPNPGQRDWGELPLPPGPVNFNANGVAGNISAISSSSLTIIDRNNNSQIININNQTVISSHRQNIKPSELKIGDDVVAIGSPDDQGRIIAKFIRIVPAYKFKK